MKKLFLLLAAGAFAMNAGAQLREAISIAPTQDQIGDRHGVNVSDLHNELKAKHDFGMGAAASHGAEKTTFTGGRWYDYGVYMDAAATYDMANGAGELQADYVYGYDQEIWKDTFGIIGYTSGTPNHAYLNLPCIGMITDPQFSGFNNTTIGYPATDMKVSASNTYVVDSIIVPGYYIGGTKHTAGTVDTLRLVMMYGTGGPSSGTSVFSGNSFTGSSHYTGTVSFLDISYDSVTDVGVASGTGFAQTMDIYLTSTDTSSSTIKSTAYEIQAGHAGSGTPAPITVSGGQGPFLATSISFISGDPAPILKTLPGDTLIGAVAPYTRYNMFRPIIDYYTQTDPKTVTTSLPNPDWAPYNATVAAPNADYNTGLFKTWPNYQKGWENTFLPNFAWTGTFSGVVGAYYYQYPEVAYHLTCTTCGSIPLSTPAVAKVNSVNAYPNPAMDAVNVSFSLTQASDVSVSLTNMLGQVVAAQKIANVASGKAVLNTSALPDGIYIYTLSANGNRTTGRVVLAH